MAPRVIGVLVVGIGLFWAARDHLGGRATPRPGARAAVVTAAAARPPFTPASETLPAHHVDPADWFRADRRQTTTVEIENE
jgi:hypothetical protein